MGWAVISLLVFSCVDTSHEIPPVKSLPYNPDLVVTIKDLKQKYSFGGNQPYTIQGDSSLFAVVTADDRSGNFYKSAIFQDTTGGITGFNNGTGLITGDSVRVYLKGVTISEYKGLIQLQNFSINENIVKIDAGIPVVPQTVTIPEATSNLDKYQSTLVKIEGVQFVDEELGLPFADTVNMHTENRTLIDKDGNTIIVRTSAYADFAGALLPEGNGSITAIFSRYNDIGQLIIRNLNDVQLTGPRFASIIQDFENGFGNWTTVSVTGSQEWEISGYGNPGNCAKMSGYDGGSNANEDWLISPAVNIEQGGAAVLKFQTAKNYTGNDLQVFVSTDYDGDVATATWTELSGYALSNGNWTWTDSGDIDLSEFAGNTIHVGFKYTSTASASATWEVDNVMISSVK